MESISTLIDTPVGVWSNHIQGQLLDAGIPDCEVFIADFPHYENSSILYVDSFPEMFRSRILSIIAESFDVIDDAFELHTHMDFLEGMGAKNVKPR